MQDFFAKTLDVTLLGYKNGEWLTNPSNNKDFCRVYIRRCELITNRCDECHKNLEKEALIKGESVICDCHIGLKIFAVPIKIKDDYLGCIIGGQFSTKKLSEKHFKKIAKDFGINERAFINEMKKLRVISKENAKYIMDLLYFVGSSIAASAYTNLELSQMGLDKKITQNPTIKKWFLQNYGNIEQPLSSREYNILKLISMGKNNTEIAKKLFLSSHTVKSQVSSMLEKFEVKDRVQLAVKAVREGLI